MAKGGLKHAGTLKPELGWVKGKKRQENLADSCLNLVCLPGFRAKFDQLYFYISNILYTACETIDQKTREISMQLKKCYKNRETY